MKNKHFVVKNHTHESNNKIKSYLKLIILEYKS